MAWLVHDGIVLATLERADTVRSRTKGLLGRDEFDGALLLEKTRSVHTFGMQFPIDAAFCDDELTIVRLVTLKRHRVARPEFRARCVIETEAGMFAHWDVHEGDQLEIRGELDGE